MTVINSGKTLRSYIEETIKSSLYTQALKEKENQTKVSPQGDTGGSANPPKGGNDIFSGGDTSGDQGDTSTSKTGDDETEKLKSGEIKTEDVVEKLNSIRSGKSFKDSAVKEPMHQYIESLSQPEKTALLAFLKGIAQIVTGEVPAQQAVDPGKDPADVSMQKEPAQKKKTVKPNVIKAQQPKQGGQEDTTAPAPIVPKKR